MNSSSRTAALSERAAARLRQWSGRVIPLAEREDERTFSGLGERESLHSLLTRLVNHV